MSIPEADMDRPTDVPDPAALVARIRADLLDGYDEELEMEIEDRSIDDALTGTDEPGARGERLSYFRNLFALIFPVTFTLRPFLAKKGHSPEDVEKMYAAWVKSCLLQVTLWSHPYVKDGDF